MDPAKINMSSVALLSMCVERVSDNEWVDESGDTWFMPPECIEAGGVEYKFVEVEDKMNGHNFWWHYHKV
jgi:hypothetical protein